MLLRRRRQAVGGTMPPGPFDGSPALCYAQKPLCAATVTETSMDVMECEHPMGQNLVIAVCPFTGCNQNDSIVLSEQAVQRGLGSSLSYHTTRFDIHHPYRLFTGYADIPGGMGVVQPGHAVHPGSAVLAAHVPESVAGESSETACEPLIRMAKADDVGIVHKVVITSGNEG